MNDSERKLAESLILTSKVSPEEMENCLRERKEGETLVDALVRQGTIRTGELELVLDELPSIEADDDNTFARAVRKIGRYRVISEIGRGGMGRVYLAYDPHLKRSVALKVMRIEELEDIARYRRETEIAAGLQHPNIAAIFDSQEEEETFVIAMQFIDGESLDKARLDPRGALKAIAEAARAVHHAHEHGIIHRDIKPENMMRSREDRIFVMDFGVARRIERKSSLTQTGTVIGTPMYMSPEQAAGRVLDVRTDVYSLGATLYALIAGRPPFVGASVLDIIQRIGKSEPPKLRAFQPDLHRDVPTLVQKAMRKERIRRYPTALAFAEDIERHLQGDPIEARPVSRFEKCVRHLRKRPWMVNALLFLALAIGVGGGLAWREKIREERLIDERIAEREKKARRDLAKERLELAIQNLDSWDRFLLFPPRDMTSKRGLLEAAVALCLSGEILEGDDLAEAHFQRARALTFLGRFAEAEKAVTRAIKLSPDSRFHLERARIRLRRMVRPFSGVLLAQADYPFRPTRAGLAVDWLREEIENRKNLDYFKDLERAEVLGRSPDSPIEVGGVLIMSEYRRARRVLKKILDRSVDPGEQAEIHRVIAWAGYREWVFNSRMDGWELVETLGHVGKALEGKRSDADLYLLQAHLVAGWSCRFREWSHEEERVRLLKKAIDGVRTALVIRPGDLHARMALAQLQMESVLPRDWFGYPWNLNKAPGEKILREGIRPAEKLSAVLVGDYPKAGEAWIQWVMIQWQELVLSYRESLPELLSRLSDAASRGLQFTLEKRARALLFYFRFLASLARFDLAGEGDEKRAARTACLSDWSMVRSVAPRLAESAESLLPPEDPR